MMCSLANRDAISDVRFSAADVTDDVTADDDDVTDDVEVRVDEVAGVAPGSFSARKLVVCCASTSSP